MLLDRCIGLSLIVREETL